MGEREASQEVGERSLYCRSNVRAFEPDAAGDGCSGCGGSGAAADANLVLVVCGNDRHPLRVPVVVWGGHPGHMSSNQSSVDYNQPRFHHMFPNEKIFSAV